MTDDLVPIGFSFDGGPFVLPIERVLRHALVTGATGAGKTAFVVGAVLSIAKRSPSTRFVLVDPKGELLDTMRTFVGALGERPPFLARQLLVIDPFAAGMTTPMNLLAPEPGLERSVQANVIVSSLCELFDGGFGPRMMSALTTCVRAAIEAGGTLLDVLELLRRPAYGARLASLIADAEVRRAVVEDFPEEAEATRAALRARLEWLVSSRPLRACLCAKDAATGTQMLEHGLTLVSLGPPSGMGAAGKAMAALIMAKISAAVFMRAVDQAADVLVVIDEAPEVLRRSAADEMERLLSMARFKRVAVWSLAQGMQQVSSSSVTLARSLATNASLRACFRGSSQDVADIAHALPVTGRMRDPHQRDRLLSVAQERALLVERTVSLPPRCALFVEAGVGATLLRTPTLPFEEARERFEALPAAERERVRYGSNSVQVDELLRTAKLAALSVTTATARGARPAASTKHRPRLVLP
ncbi:hypothetical protein EPO34_02680 [Patescibacteria group bacterium]|nr:MAG: hypothetical protein EPO34_02680 [Patescibacteria group bacterium]